MEYVRKKVGFTMKKGNPWALLPIAVFLVLFIAVGIIDNRMGGMFGDSLPAIVGFLIALIVAFLQNPKGTKLTFEEKLNTMARGAGEENIMIMCLVFILAGAFSASVKAAGGADPSPTSPAFFGGLGAHSGLSAGDGERVPSGGKAPQRGRSGRHRVDGDALCGSGIIDTIGPPQADEPLSVALAKGHGNAAAP